MAYYSGTQIAYYSGTLNMALINVSFYHRSCIQPPDERISVEDDDQDHRSDIAKIGFSLLSVLDDPTITSEP